ncbi:hypothetical protein [Neptuniibacter sp. QD37_11]|uniref:hypothetical protein n=1 Tax=Neptuniibacter sp. QD37_11 TaxID=3398209 RepID=UPI0039F6358A
MFKSRKEREAEQMIGAINAVANLAHAVNSGDDDTKPASVQRMESLAQTVAALGFSPESIGAVEISWEKICCDGSDQLVPVMRMTSVGGEVEKISGPLKVES